MPHALEPMTETHRAAVIDIYNHFIRNGFAAYSDSPVPYEFFDRFLEMTRGYPAFVVRADVGDIVGFGFLRAYHPAPTMRRTAEIGYFIHPSHTRRGVGAMLLERLIDEGRRLGVDNLLACVSSRNDRSLAFHRKHGFVERGRLAAAGRKFGQDFDVVWMQRRI